MMEEKINNLLSQQLETVSVVSLGTDRVKPPGFGTNFGVKRCRSQYPRNHANQLQKQLQRFNDGFTV